MSPKFPLPVRQRGRLFFWRSHVEAYKRALAGLPPKALDPDLVDVLLPAAALAAEFGVGRRTIGRRVAEAEGAGLAIAG
jgi:hypothetical protein